MKDILLDKNNDLIISDGDFDIGHSDDMHQLHILLAEKGEYKEFPELGVGIGKMLSDDDFIDLLIEAKKNLEYDGMEIDKIKFTEDGKLKVVGKYKTQDEN